MIWDPEKRRKAKTKALREAVKRELAPFIAEFGFKPQRRPVAFRETEGRLAQNYARNRDP